MSFRNQNQANTVVLRVALTDRKQCLSDLLAVLSDSDVQVIAVDMVALKKGRILRDITIKVADDAQCKQVTEAVQAVEGVTLIHASDRTFLMHLGGKIEVRSKKKITNREELSRAYTPDVARVCMAIHDKPEKVHSLTIKRNTVAVVTDGSAVLGLGNIGPEAAMPVMEGKAMLLKDFGGVDAFPICLDTQDTEAIIDTVMRIAPGFGGINLEDISAPRCFEIERRLDEALDIPVFHDDQHGTAIVMLAAMINAFKLTGRSPEDAVVVINGVGAAGTACKNMLLEYGVKNIIGCDSRGILKLGREGMNPSKDEFARSTNPGGLEGSVHDAVKAADVFVGLSVPDVLTVDDLKNMNKDPIVFAMSNPDPEIKPELARDYVAVMATGRSDYPNQINNVLAFPGIFRGALDCRARSISPAMMLAAAHAIANIIPEEALASDYIVPSVFDQAVVKAVAQAVQDAFEQA